MKRLTMRTVYLTMLALFTGILTVSVALAADPLTLKPVKDLGVPTGQTEAQWMSAKGKVTVDGHSIKITASNLVPNGVYTAWWMDPPMTVGPLLRPPANELKVDAQGNGTLNDTLAHNLGDHAMLVIAYHSDGKTHGDVPGDMGVNLFNHLVVVTKGVGSAGSLPKTGEAINVWAVLAAAGLVFGSAGVVLRRFRTNVGKPTAGRVR